MKLEFKPAALAKPKRYEIAAGAIRELDESGMPVTTFPVATAEGVRWHQTYANFFITRTLEISGGGEKLVLSQVMRAGRNAQDPDVAAFLRAVSASLSAVSERKPDLRVEMEQPALFRWAGFGIYTLAILGLYALMSMVLDRRDASDLWWLTAILGAAAVFCAFMAWRGRPWRETETITPHDLSLSLIQQMR
ncbi:MAG: hypothetical protein ACQGVK_06820 [Myxococcota bacterium]